jgi:hypothetical protein
MHPFLQQIADAQRADLRMVAGAIEIGRAQRAHQCRAVAPHRGELVEQRADRPLAVGACSRHLVLVPRRERRTLRALDDANPPGKAATLGLDEMADDLLGAPLTRRRVPRDDALGQRTELRAQRRHRRLQTGGDVHRRQGFGGRGHGHRHTLVTIADGSSSSARRSAPASSASWSWLIAKIRHWATLPGRYFRISVSGSIDTVRVAES